jgi:primosomal protein N' (replication factor Y)
LYAEIIVQIDAPHLPQPFTYGVPEGLTLRVGDAVIVPFGSQTATGHVVGLRDDCPLEMAAKIKPVTAQIENGAAFDAALYELACWVSEQTLCDLRDAVRLIAPEVMASQIQTTLRLTDDWEQRLTGTRSEAQKDLAAALASLGGETTPAKLAKALGQTKPGSALSELRKKGVVTEERSVRKPPSRRKVVRLLRLSLERDVAAEEATRLERAGAPRQAKLLRALMEAETAGTKVPSSGLAVGPTASAAARALAAKGLAAYIEVPVRRDPFPFFGFVPSRPHALTDAQTRATEALGASLAAGEGQTVLLHGVTGSGKTEVYLDAVARTLAQGRGALLLLPEIGLTAQVLDVFKSRFGTDDVAVLHSALSPGERHDEWRRIQSGDARVVLGARSAVFAPVQNLGLIILDEEHDGSYKQDMSPRYHARDVAIRRAAQTGAVVVLGSATPSLESRYKAQTGEYALLTLAERIDDRPLPPVEVIDLRAELKAPKEPPPSLPLRAGGGVNQEKQGGGPSVLGSALQEALGVRLERHEQAILFLNRRGFASFLLCRDCGYTFKCVNCAVSLTYHHAARRLQCHHCDYQRRAPDLCPQCQGIRLRPFGLGTEKVEQAVRELFPKARTLRMDRDTMARKGAHAETLRAFRKGDADILIGTQMVAKGLDFPRVTLVGVVSADTALNMPDFRAGERAFQLLTQVAGRAGRGEMPGEVIVQTFTPDHASVLLAAEHDYNGFYAAAIEERRELSYPPFSHLANAVFADENEAQAEGGSRRLADILRVEIERQHIKAQVLGPVSCPLARLRNRYRWHLVVRCEKKEVLLGLFRAALASLTQTDRLGLSLDIDPMTML